jgi:hypothetical protein
VIDLAGKTVIPGLVMLHEHLYCLVGPGVYGQLGQSFVRLYLAGGVTTKRTGGNMNGFMDLNLKRGVEEGRVAGPAIDATAPYVNGANTFVQMRSMADADEARRQVAYWADMGATSFKAYMQISRAQLGAVIQEAHKRGLKVTGHLCSVTYAEAAGLGIDNLEHGFRRSVACHRRYPQGRDRVPPGRRLRPESARRACHRPRGAVVTEVPVGTDALVAVFLARTLPKSGWTCVSSRTFCCTLRPPTGRLRQIFRCVTRSSDRQITRFASH